MDSFYTFRKGDVIDAFCTLVMENEMLFSRSNGTVAPDY